MHTHKEFIKNSEGEEIAAVLHHPEEKPNGTVLLQHGLFSNKEGKWKKRAEHLARKGFLAIRFDRRGYGESDLNFVNFTLSTGISDTKTLLNYLEKQERNNFAILGSSFGGIIGICVAAEDDRINSLSLRSPVTYPENLLPDLRRRVKEEGRVKIEEMSDSWMDRKFFQDLDSYDMEKKINQLNIPTIVFHGTSDDIVPIRNSRRFFREIDVEKDLVEFEGEGHVFSIQIDSRVLDRTASWFSKHI